MELTNPVMYSAYYPPGAYQAVPQMMVLPPMDAQTYQQMRGKSYQEVLRTNGQISFPEVLRQQRRW